MFYRDTWAEIRLDALRDNVKELIKLSDKKLFAVIKANGYGAGDYQVAKTAVEAGASYLAVSSLDEALSLRMKGIVADILVLGYTRPENVLVAKKHHITLTAPSIDWVYKVIEQNITDLKIHLKIDTGMNRLGFTKLEEVEEAISLLKENYLLEGIYTHYANSDDADGKMNDYQYHKFSSILKQLNYSFKWIHCSNSDATVHYREEDCNAVRCGIALLGISTFKANLKQVVSLYTKVVHIKEVEQDQPVSYGGNYRTKGKEWIATVPIGYADGWLRANEGGIVYIEQEQAQFVGRICMDQAMLRVPNYYPVGTVVELIGSQITVQEVAKRLNTIPYEILTLINDRIVRVYYDGEHVVDITNPRLDR